MKVLPTTGRFLFAALLGLSICCSGSGPLPANVEVVDTRLGQRVVVPSDTTDEQIKNFLIAVHNRSSRLKKWNLENPWIWGTVIVIFNEEDRELADYKAAIKAMRGNGNAITREFVERIRGTYERHAELDAGLGTSTVATIGHPAGHHQVVIKEGPSAEYYYQMTREAYSAEKLNLSPADSD